MWKKIIKVVNATVLCVRFPFLYPRNRFTNLHYNNWKILDWTDDLSRKYHHFVKTENLEAGQRKHFIKTIGIFCDYWTSVWACLAYNTVRWLHNNVIQLFHCIPSYTELDGMPRGWEKAFGLEMCKDIRKALLKKGGIKLLYQYRIMDIKEKFGELRWYSNGTFKELEEVIDKYATKSAETCISCGAKAVWMTDYRDWASPYCDKCIPDYTRERAEVIS